MTITDSTKSGPRRLISVEEVIADFSLNTQTDLLLARSNVLAAISAACQGLIDVAYPQGGRSPTGLIVFTVAESGIGKTPVQRLAFSAVQAFERHRQATVDKERHDQYEADRVVWKAKQKGLTAKLRREASHGQDSSSTEALIRAHSISEPKAPRATSLLYDNVTPAAFFSKLVAGWPYVCLCNSDAGDALFGTSFEDLTDFNKVFDGDTISRQRVSAPSSVVHNARLTMSISVQPEIFHRFVHRKNGVAHVNGFLPRALIAMPSSNVGYRDVRSRSDNVSPLAIRFNARVQSLLTRVAREVDGETNERRLVTLSEHATHAWLEYAQHLETGSAPGGIYADIKAHASKMGNIVLRIAALLEYFEFDAILVSLPSMQEAIRLGNQYLNMARNAYRAGPSEADLVALARQMLMWLRQQCAVLGPIGHGHITSRCPGVFRGKDSLLEQTLDHLLVNGFVLQVPSVRGKRYVPTAKPGLDA